MGEEEEDHYLSKLSVDGKCYRFYDLVRVCGPQYERLPFAVRILLECLIRKSHEDRAQHGGDVWRDNVRKLLDYKSHADEDILFHPSRVLLQDFTGVPALIDLASLRDVIEKEGGDLCTVDSLCPADLVVDHTVQLDFTTIQSAVQADAAKRSQQKRDEEEKLAQQMTEMQLQQQQQQPTIIVHSAFAPPPTVQPNPAYPPPNACYPGYDPYAAAAPLYLPAPNYYPVSQYQYVPCPTPVEVSTPPKPNPPAPSQKKKDEVPTDNPGLPLQDEVCPFHQRISHWADQLKKNKEREFSRNQERFAFLKWVNQAFKNITVIPPGTGVMHQVNLEYLARVVTRQDDLLYPDSLIGTDSHTTMINGLGVLGWGVGTLDAESVMFGHPITMPIPKVVGCRISGEIPTFATSTEVVLLVTKKLRHTGVSGCFIEFFGPSVQELSIADRATIANMCPEYGALVGFFPPDEQTLEYLAQTGRDKPQVDCMKEYFKRVKLLRNKTDPDPDYSSVIEINLSDVQPCISGPKRTKDKVPIPSVSQDFNAALTAKEGAKGFGLSPDQIHSTFTVDIDGALHTIQHGAVLLAAIASCSNTSNPSVMLGAGLLAKKAIEAGLSVPKYVRTSMSPGSGVVTSYLQDSGVMPYLYMLGFEVVGYGCSSCVNNSKPLPSAISDAVKHGNVVCCGVLSGNRNFEGRIQSDIKANYLASPMLVIAYAISGRVNIDFETEPVGHSAEGAAIFLKDIWPSRKEIQEKECRDVIPGIFRRVYGRIQYGNEHWSKLPTPETELYAWNAKSTFIQSPLYIREIFDKIESPAQSQLLKMRCLIKLGDNVTSDFISPAGSIVRNSPAAEYLNSLGLVPREYNSYGARRGNYEVMMRGSFAHIRLKNELSAKPGPFTTHFPSEVPTSIFEAAQRYKEEKVPLMIIAGENFGRGASRDWATKGPFLLGVRAILAVSFDPSYRSNLVKTGILPVQIDRMTYEILTGRERIDVLLPNLDKLCERVAPPGDRKVSLVLNGDFDLSANLRLDNSYEMKLFKDGGIIKQMIKKSLNSGRRQSGLESSAEQTVS